MHFKLDQGKLNTLMQQLHIDWISHSSCNGQRRYREHLDIHWLDNSTTTVCLLQRSVDAGGLVWKQCAKLADVTLERHDRSMGEFGEALQDQYLQCCYIYRSVASLRAL